MSNCASCGGTMVSISGNIYRCEYCGKLYSNTNGELSVADPARLYDSAVNMAKNNNESSLKSAIETLEALGSYKDSSALANTYRGMIAQSRVEAEERRLEAERQAELERIQSEKRAFEAKQKARIRGIVIATVSAVAVVAVAVVVINNSNKAASYNKALELYNMGQYEDAVEAFNNLGDYSDSASYVSTINNFLKERDSKYEKGVGYYEKAAYSECITTLTEISGYLDSTEYIDKSVEALFQQATEKFEAGELEKAKELLSKIPAGSSKHMDAELLLANIEEIIIEQENAANYEQAKAYFDNGDYASAQRLFISLGNYEDSDTYRSSIGNIYYEQASNLFNQQEYVQCGDILQYIDTAEEWREYLLAQEMFGRAKEIYLESIVSRAKDICRNENDNAMGMFINDKICCLLSADEAINLKENCRINKIPLSSMEPYVGGLSAYSMEEYRTDTMGNIYSYTLLGASKESTGDHSATYFIDKKYTTFSATVAVKRAGNYGIIRIYGDDRLLWADEAIHSDTKPYPIEIDISGITDLKIAMYADNMHIILCDPILCE